MSMFEVHLWETHVVALPKSFFLALVFPKIQMDFVFFLLLELASAGGKMTC